MAESELRGALENCLLALQRATWINHPQANRLTRNKLLQQARTALADQAGEREAARQEITRLTQRVQELEEASAASPSAARPG